MTAELQNKLTTVQTERKQAEMKSQHLRVEIDQKLACSKDAEAAHRSLTKRLSEKTSELSQLESQIERLNFSPTLEASLSQEKVLCLF